MENKMTIREWQEAYKAGKFNSSLNSQCEAGWYDWFCKSSSLANRLKRLAPVVLGITNKFILDNFYVWFKNNCPCVGPLYDDIRFEPLDESLREKQYFLVVHNDKREDSNWVVYTAENIWGGNCKESSFKANRLSYVTRFINEMKF